MFSIVTTRRWPSRRSARRRTRRQGPAPRRSGPIRGTRDRLLVELGLQVLGVPQVGYERRSDLNEEGLEFGIRGVGDQGVIQRLDHLLVVGDLVVDIGLNLNAAPLRVRRVARFWSPPLFSDRLVSFSSGVTPSFVTRSTAALFTAVWSMTIVFANCWTSESDEVEAARLPASDVHLVGGHDDGRDLGDR